MAWINNAIVQLMLFATLVASQSSYDYCNLLEEVISICEQSTPGYLSLPATAQANCACGTMHSTIPWGPASYDNLASACASQYATIDVTIAQDAQNLEGFCTMYAGQAASSAASTQIVPSTSVVVVS